MYEFEKRIWRFSKKERANWFREFLKKNTNVLGQANSHLGKFSTNWDVRIHVLWFWENLNCASIWITKLVKSDNPKYRDYDTPPPDWCQPKILLHNEVRHKKPNVSTWTALHTEIKGKWLIWVLFWESKVASARTSFSKSGGHASLTAMCAHFPIVIKPTEYAEVENVSGSDIKTCIVLFRKLQVLSQFGTFGIIHS